jgi:hypothetical protein
MKVPAIRLSNAFKLVAGLLWSGVVVLGAAPADAYVVTPQTGAYATCQPSYSYEYNNVCDVYPTSYLQYIRLVAVACASGGCSKPFTGIYTDYVSQVGRKPTWFLSSCSGYNVYGLDTCAC